MTTPNLVGIAQQELGVPYVWGGASPAGFDCSGLVQWVYGQDGIKIPRTSREQKAAGVSIPLSQAQPGDLLLYTYNGSPSNPGPDNHIGIYTGPGQMIDAPRPGKSVEYDPIDMSAFDTAVRIPGNPGLGGQGQAAETNREASYIASAGWAPGGDWDPLNWPGDLLSATGGVFSGLWNSTVGGVEGAIGDVASSILNSLLSAIGPIILTTLTIGFAAVLIGMGLWRMTESPREKFSEAGGEVAPLAAMAV